MTNGTTLVSVIIPTYNRRDLLKRAIRSAQDQTIENIEILVCDDGSTDDTKETIEKISKEDARVRFIPGVHSGRPASPRNNGIGVSRAEWVAFLDSDDYWHTGKLERQLNHVRKNNALACCTNALCIRNNRTEQNPMSSFSESYITFENLLKSNHVICSSVLIKRNTLEGVGPFPVSDLIIEDYAMWLRISSITSFLFLNENLTFYNDDTEDSIRKKDIQDTLLQKEYILKDYLRWSFGYPFSWKTLGALLEYSKIKFKTLFK